MDNNSQEQDSAERHWAVAGESLVGSVAGHSSEEDRVGQGVPLPVQPAEERPAAADDLVEEPERCARHNAVPEGMSAGRKAEQHNISPVRITKYLLKWDLKQS